MTSIPWGLGRIASIAASANNYGHWLKPSLFLVPSTSWFAEDNQVSIARLRLSDDSCEWVANQSLNDDMAQRAFRNLQHPSLQNGYRLGSAALRKLGR